MSADYFCLLIFLALGQDLLAQEKPVEVIPDSTGNLETTRSTIVAADGYAYLAEDIPMKLLRRQAKDEAMRNAVERGEVFIQSITEVWNSILKYDLIHSETAGYLTIIDEKDYGIEQDNRYHYWVKGEVRYRLRPKEARTSVPPELWQDPKGPLSVRVWTDTTHYAEGQFMRIHLQGNKDFYARVVYRDVAGNLIQLLPNQFRNANHFAGERLCQIPDASAGDKFQLRVRPPFGTEEIIVYASTAPQDSINMIDAGQGLSRFAGSGKELGQRTRSVEVVSTSAEPGKAEFYEARWQVTTHSQARE